MRRNSIAIGEKHMEGDYNRILAAGDVSLTASTANKLYAAGSVKLRNTKVKKLRCAGEFDGDTVTIGTGKFSGNSSFHGVCSADSLVVSGAIKAEYLECRSLRNGSLKAKPGESSSMSGFFKATTFENIVSLNLNCEYEFETMIVSEVLTSSNEIACTNFYGFGKVIAPCINAETVFLLASAGTKVNELAGTDIIVSNVFKIDKAFKIHPKSIKYKNLITDIEIINIDVISGDKVSLKGVRSHSVSGIDVEIGDLSIIEEVVYQKSIKISDKAVVGRVLKQ